MKRKTKKYFIIGGIILGIALVVLFASGIFKMPFAVGGTSTLSLSQAQLQSQNSYLNGKAWLLTFSSGGLGQRYTGTFSPYDVQSATSDSSTTTKDFTIDVQYSDQTCNYPIVQTGLNTPIYDLQRKTWFCLASTGEADAKKTSGFSNILYYGKYSGETSCFAIGYNTQSPVGNLNAPGLSSTFDITINAAGKTATKTISTLSGSTQGAVGDFAYAIWQGNLVSGQSCPSKSPYIPIYANGVWRIGSSSYYNDYKPLLSQLATSSKDTQDIIFSQIQTKIAQAKQSQSFGAINSDTSLNNAVAIVTLQNQIQFPVTTLYIKADTIGIFTPTPSLEITSASSDCFKTGEQGGISVNLKNTGDASGVWNVYATCQSPFSSTTNLQVGLSAGQSISKIIPISASATQKTTSSCTIYAESPAGTKSVNVGVCVNPQITCNANQKFCAVSGQSEVIKQCSSDGATSSIIETCGQGYYCENAECKQGDNVSGPGFLSKVRDFFRNLFGGALNFFSIIRIVVVIIVFVFSMLFGRDLMESFKITRKNKALAWILAIVVALGLAVLTFTVFWVGIIAAIIYVIVRFIIRRK